MSRAASAACVLAALGCSTHHRISAGPTLRVPDGDAGAQITGESAHGGGPVMLVGAATARAGHDATGVALRVGVELQRESTAWSWRWNLTAGPAFRDDDETARFDGRMSLGLVRGFRVRPVRTPDDWAYVPDDWMTGGVEVFANLLGMGEPEVLVGLAVTIGWFTRRGLGLAASAPRE